MPTAGTSWRTRLSRVAIQLSFTVLALGILAAPFGIAWYRHILGLQVTEQFSTAAAVLTPQEAALAAALDSELPSQAPPVVLAYHDIRPLDATEADPDPTHNDKHHYVVTPEAFDAQLTALQAAGYISITSDQYVAYLNGGQIPERSVLITFDDGTHGLWTHADKILERHGMHGVAFLITGNVGLNRPYYLSWQEIERMAASGRWDFQSHTRKMHARLPVNAEGDVASEMVHRRWLFEKNRVESLAEFKTKIRADLRGSIQDILDQDLPRPVLFAFPFSEGFRDSETADPEAAAAASDVIDEMFTASMNNAPPQPLPSGARAAAKGMVGRVEVTLDTTVADLLAEVRAHTPVAPEQALPADRTDLWTKDDGYPAPVKATGNEVRLLGTGHWQKTVYGVHATADWASYHGSVTLSGLAVPGVANAAVVSRIGTDEEVFTLVSSDSVRLTVRRGAVDEVVKQLPLKPSDRHTVAFDVSPTATVVVIDGRIRVKAPSGGDPGSYGGIGLTSYRDDPSAPWPAFTDLSLNPGEDYPGVRSGVGVPTSK
ncbi:polysaccharide deacetylase family protein [Mycolicibacterium mengxianglii]|uniref:polysaccharide deacetylase family protein n=1 Tax=Mycolicibacterium mengxianglii TaxID=2736649 RepID=UPI001E43E5F6|nr:polysaccharide deacetylase family protein [Mycolicibacterium mengxianglii]